MAASSRGDDCSQHWWDAATRADTLQLEMSSPLDIVDHHLKIRTHCIASAAAAIAIADADAVSVFTIANFEVTIRGRIDVVGCALCIALSRIASNLYHLAVFDESNYLKLYRIRIRFVKDAPMIVNHSGSFHLEDPPTSLLITPDLCLVCANQAYVVVNGSIQCLNLPATTAAITSGHFAIATSDTISFFKGNRLQWSTSCSSVSSLLFASLSLIVGHYNGAISVYSPNGSLLSRILACDSITRLLGQFKCRMHSSSSGNTILKSLPLQLFNHEPEIFDHAIILQTNTGIMLWPYRDEADGNIQCPTIRDLLNYGPSYDFTENIQDLCVIFSDASFTILLATEDGVIARSFLSKCSENLIANNVDRKDKSVIDAEASEGGEVAETITVQQARQKSLGEKVEQKIMDFLPEHTDTISSVPLNNVSILQDVMDLKRQCRESSLEITDLKRSLSAFTGAMAGLITELCELLDND